MLVPGASSNATHSIGSQVIRAIILPELEKEVNEGKNFANLRQMYSGMILATWYKRALKESLLGKIYADKSKVKGVDQDPKTNEEIYQRYLKAFKKGVFNYIKEDMDRYTHEAIPRKYFSGGFENELPQVLDVRTAENPPSSAMIVDAAMQAKHIKDVRVDIQEPDNRKGAITRALTENVDRTVASIPSDIGLIDPEEYARELNYPTGLDGTARNPGNDEGHLPFNLRKLADTVSWPIDTTMPFHMALYHKDKGPFREEGGIAIQVPAGTPVKAVQGGKLYYMVSEEYRQGMSGSVEVYILTKEGILWHYRDIDSLPKKFAKNSRIGFYSKLEIFPEHPVEVAEGESIGNVMKWGKTKYIQLPKPAHVNPKVKQKFGNDYSHLFLEAWYSPSLRVELSVSEGRMMDPLFFLKPLGKRFASWQGNLVKININAEEQYVWLNGKEPSLIDPIEVKDRTHSYELNRAAIRVLKFPKWRLLTQSWIPNAQAYSYGAKEGEGLERHESYGLVRYSMSPSYLPSSPFSLDSLNKRLGIDLIDEIKNAYQKFKPTVDRPFVILDLDCRQGNVLQEIFKKLEKAGIDTKLIKMVGVSTGLFKEWSNLSSGIDIIFDFIDQIDRYLPFQSVGYVFYNKIRPLNPEEIKALSAVLAPEVNAKGTLNIEPVAAEGNPNYMPDGPGEGRVIISSNEEDEAMIGRPDFNAYWEAIHNVNGLLSLSEIIQQMLDDPLIKPYIQEVAGEIAVMLDNIGPRPRVGQNLYIKDERVSHSAEAIFMKIKSEYRRAKDAEPRHTTGYRPAALSQGSTGRTPDASRLYQDYLDRNEGRLSSNQKAALRELILTLKVMKAMNEAELKAMDRDERWGLVDRIASRNGLDPEDFKRLITPVVKLLNTRNEAMMTTGKRTVVVADDDSGVLLLNAEVLKLVLEPQGFTVLTAASPAELKQVMESHGEEVSLLVTDTTDWIGPVKEVLSKLSNRGIRIIAVSGADSREDWEKANVPIDAFLKKPYGLSALIGEVNRILPKDTAMQASSPGGIDFNAANLNLQIKRDGHGVPLPISQQDLEHINIDGLVPIIIDIKPAASLPIFADLKNTASSEG